MKTTTVDHSANPPDGNKAAAPPPLPLALQPSYQRLLLHVQCVQRFRGPLTAWRTQQYAQQLAALLREPLSPCEQAHLLQVATQSWYHWMQARFPAGSVLVNACVLRAAALSRELRRL